MSSVLYIMDLVGILRPLVTMITACAIIAILAFFFKRA